MDRDRAVRISKLLSLGLRHAPDALGVELDAAGWTGVEGVLRGLAARGEPLSVEELAEIVRTSDKQRFALSPDGARIRANQGHSKGAARAAGLDLSLPPREPPEVLYHGTVERFLESIQREGLLPRARTHVHLSADVETARAVASRRAGRAVILGVRARAMHDAGHVFVVSGNGVWLTEHVPPGFLELDLDLDLGRRLSGRT